MSITVSQKQQGDVPVTVIHIKGDLDMNLAGQLEAQARQAHQDGARNMLIDMTEVPYMSSAGLRTIHLLFEMLRGDTSAESSEAMRKGLASGTFKSPHLKLLKPSPRVREVLKISGYDMFLELHSGLESALASFE